MTIMAECRLVLGLIMVILSTATARIASAQDAGVPPLPHGLQLGVGLSVGRPYLLGDMGDSWHGVGGIRAGLGRDVTLDYYGDRFGVGLALELMPTRVGDYSARAINGGLLLHWRPMATPSAWEPVISAGYALFYLRADEVRISAFTGNVVDFGTWANPWIRGHGGRLALRVGHGVSKHIRVVLQGQADAVILEHSLHAFGYAPLPGLEANAPSELRATGWAIVPQFGIQLQWNP